MQAEGQRRSEREFARCARDSALKVYTAIVVLLIGLCGTNSAQASCGDYVLTGLSAQSAVGPDGDVSLPHNFMMHAAAFDQHRQVPSPPIRSNSPVQHHQPCHGPGCHRQIPVVPIVPVENERFTREWGTFCKFDVLTIPVVQWIVIEPILVLSDTMSMRIERPPRSPWA